MFSALVGVFVGPCDVLLAPSPPLTIGLSACVLGRLRCAPFRFELFGSKIAYVEDGKD